MNRVYNFSAGPSMLPESVLKRAADEMLNYQGSGQSVMEMSHRSKVYEKIIGECKALLREVMNIPDNYEVLLLHGGASTQFAMVPLNLAVKSGKGDYIVTGQFSKKAYQEGKKLIEAKEVLSSADQNFTCIPELDSSKFTKDADFLHICMNNTIYGSKYVELPETGDVPLVADVSSCILSEPIDVSKFGLLYAGVQKNMAPAGMAVAIVRKDLIGEPREGTPTMLTYKIHAENDSMYNTPPAYTIYMCKLVLEWLKNEVGGLEEIKKVNEYKAGLLYDFIDNSKLFSNPVVKKYRSIMNVPFVTGSDELDKKFVNEAEAAGLVNIKGHRSVGGMRASIYNAMPVAGVEALIKFMGEFEKQNA